MPDATPTLVATPIHELRQPVEDQAVQDAIAARVLRGELTKQEAELEVLRLLDERDAGT